MEQQPDEDRASPEIVPFPTRIGRYQIQELLGRGAFGWVLAAQDPVLNRRVAVKVIKPDAPAEVRLELLERFRMEAQVLGSLAHPNIVSVYDAGFDDNMPFLAMELCDGPNLETILEKRKTLTTAQAVYVTLQAASGIDYVHRNGIIHRDLKPSNILYHKGQFKITDFGLARTTRMGRMTAAGQVMGTPHFMSPEQAGGEPLDHRSDLYSLAAIVFHLLAGRPPFRGDPAAVMASLVSRPPPRLSLVIPNHPKEMDEVLNRALARIPGDRYQTAQELCADLLKIVPRDVVDAQANLARWFERGEHAVAEAIDDPTPSGAPSLTVSATSTGAVKLPSGIMPAAGRSGAVQLPALDLEVPPEELGRLGRLLYPVVSRLRNPPSRGMAAVGLIAAAFLVGVGAGHGAKGLYSVFGPTPGETGPAGSTDAGGAQLAADGQPVGAGAPSGALATGSGTGARADAAPVKGKITIPRNFFEDLFKDDPDLAVPMPSSMSEHQHGRPRDAAGASSGSGGLGRSMALQGGHGRGRNGDIPWAPDEAAGGIDPSGGSKSYIGTTGPALAAIGRETKRDWQVKYTGQRSAQDYAAPPDTAVAAVIPDLEVGIPSLGEDRSVATIEVTMKPHLPGYSIYAKWRPKEGKWTPALLYDLRAGYYDIHVVDAHGLVELQLEVVNPYGRPVRKVNQLVQIPDGR